MKIVDDSPPVLSALDRPNSYIGRSVPRPNLERLTQGRGQYVSDVVLQRMAHVAYVRSPHAHARIVKIGTEAAKKSPGVIAVVTGAELVKVMTPWVGVLTHLKGLKSAPQSPIAVERACWQGEAVCAVVANTRAEAEDALPVLEGLNARGYDSAVTYLGENVTTLKAARAAADTYCTLLDEIHRRGLRTTPSLKLTHLGLDLGEDVALENVERVLDRAGGTVVWFDMEGSAYTDRTLAFYGRVRRRWANVACVVQAYLYRTEADLKGLIAAPGHPVRVRLCKGAYRESATIAFPRKADVDRNYARLAGLLLSPAAQRAGVYPGFATHDERIQRVLLEKTRELGIPPDRFEFQMLTGIRSDLHAVVREAGARLRVLVPFGEDWYGYFVRRLAERPANLLFLAKNLARG